MKHLKTLDMVHRVLAGGKVLRRGVCTACAAWQVARALKHTGTSLPEALELFCEALSHEKNGLDHEDEQQAKRPLPDWMY
ncbi:MAG: hypothetical protein AAGJ10_11405 [Bacteroidota bacterium]